jgi:hypothetical protein
MNGLFDPSPNHSYDIIFYDRDNWQEHGAFKADGVHWLKLFLTNELQGLIFLEGEVKFLASYSEFLQ